MNGFKIRKRETANFNTPQEMYDDYKNREIEGIHDYQSKMIDLYMEEAYDKSDVALELPTGTGKTLIGLLIGEFRRRKNREKVIYLCPTNQLVNQTVEYAQKKYGIKATAFTGSIKTYNPGDKMDYSTAQSIAVTSYSSLFNVNSFFKDADIIIFDDAHSGENYIASNWTVTIDRKNTSELYYLLIENVKDYIDESIYSKLLLENPLVDDLSWFDKIPNFNLWGKYSDIQKIVDEYISENTSNIRFPWSNIRNNLHACNVFISWKEIIIRPYIPPTLTHRPFADAKQRIYMSATPGKSGELERAFGIPAIHRLPMVKDWENKSIGRKFFMFPYASFDVNQTRQIIKEITTVTNRVLMIVNDSDTQTAVTDFLSEETSVEIFTSKDIELSKEKFIESEHGFAVVANRFDGIDFQNDECRMLILFDLPNATHLQEKFLITRMAAMTLFEERIKTRIVQALGRCTRSQTDYAAVCILGDDLMNSLLSPSKVIQLNAELQAELIFGQDNSKDQNSISEYLSLLNIFLNERENWSEAEDAILGIRDEIIKNGVDMENKSFGSLMKASKNEVLAQYCIWKEDYLQALKHIDAVLSNLSDDDSLKGYRGFWSYIGGFCAFALYKLGNEIYENTYEEYLQKAASTTISINWFNKFKNNESDQNNISNGMEDIIENLERKIQKTTRGSIKRFYDDLNNIKNLLDSNDGEEFEKGHQLLGDWLGYKTLNPTGQAEPDPIWIINDNICIVAEDKIYESDSKLIPPKHVKQAMGHENWVISNSEKLSLKKDPDIITVFISNSNVIEEAASIHGKNIYYIKREDLISWANKCIDVLKEVRRTFNSLGDLLWREAVIDIFIKNKITPDDYIKLIKSKKLSDL